MKRLILIFLVLFTANAFGQNPVQRKDTLNTNRTDSVDFRDHPGGHISDTAALPEYRQKDSLPMDDRKPKNPPKK